VPALIDPHLAAGGVRAGRRCCQRGRQARCHGTATDSSAGLRSSASLAGSVALVGTVATLALAIGYIADYDPGRGGLQHITDVVWIKELGIHYKLAVSGAERVPARPHGAAVRGRGSPPTAAPGIGQPSSYLPFFMLAESAVLGAFTARTSRCSWRSST